MVLMISSSGLVTLVSISSGDAPRNVVVTVMMGSSTLGNWSMPMSWKENQPSTTRNKFIIVANTGRLMHKSAMPSPPLVGGASEECSVAIRRRLIGRARSGFGLRRLNRNRCSIRKFALPVDDNLVARFHTRNDFLQSIAHPPDHDLAAAGFAILNHEHL